MFMRSYAYADNNPVNLVDPSGMMTIEMSNNAVIGACGGFDFTMTITSAPKYWTTRDVLAIQYWCVIRASFSCRPILKEGKVCGCAIADERDITGCCMWEFLGRMPVEVLSSVPDNHESDSVIGPSCCRSLGREIRTSRVFIVQDLKGGLAKIGDNLPKRVKCGSLQIETSGAVVDNSPSIMIPGACDLSKLGRIKDLMMCLESETWEMESTWVCCDPEKFTGHLFWWSETKGEFVFLTYDGFCRK
jgi:hypothetical protein